MFDDDQTVLLGVAALFFVPLVSGWLLRRWLRRGVAALITAAVLGLAGLYFGPGPALLIAVWSLGLAWWAAADDFAWLPRLDELARDAKNGRRRWWDLFG